MWLVGDGFPGQGWNRSLRAKAVIALACACLLSFRMARKEFWGSLDPDEMGWYMNVPHENWIRKRNGNYHRFRNLFWFGIIWDRDYGIGRCFFLPFVPLSLLFSA